MSKIKFFIIVMFGSPLLYFAGIIFLPLLIIGNLVRNTGKNDFHEIPKSKDDAPLLKNLELWKTLLVGFFVIYTIIISWLYFVKKQ